MYLTCRPWVWKVPGLHLCYNRGYPEIRGSCQFLYNGFGGFPYFLQINTGVMYLHWLQSPTFRLLHCSISWSFAHITLRVITNEDETGCRTQEPISLSLSNSLRITFIVLAVGVGTILASVLFAFFINAHVRRKRLELHPDTNYTETTQTATLTSVWLETNSNTYVMTSTLIRTTDTDLLWSYKLSAPVVWISPQQRHKAIWDYNYCIDAVNETVHARANGYLICWHEKYGCLDAST